MSTPVGNTARFSAGYNPKVGTIVTSNITGAPMLALMVFAFNNQSGQNAYVNILSVLNQSDSGAGEVTFCDQPIFLPPGNSSISIFAPIDSIPAGDSTVFLWMQTGYGGISPTYSKLYYLVLKA